MSNSIPAQEPLFQFPSSQMAERNAVDQRQYDILMAELQASLAREDALRKERSDLWQRQVMLAREFEHRITNGLQLIASVLSLQSRSLTTAEGRIQLGIAARRIVALGSVHHRLHPLDQPANVEFKQFLIGLCHDLSGLLLANRTDHGIVVEGVKVEMPSSLASPLGLIATELITNSVKHANGKITVRIERTASATYSLSVLDDGPGLPVGVEATKSKGLGMKLVRWLLGQIGGDLKIIPRANGSSARVTVIFCCPSSGNDET